MGVIVALDGKAIMLGVHLDESAPTYFQMLAERNRDRPEQFVGVGGEADAFAKIKQEKRVRLGLLAPRNILNGDVHAKQLAALVAPSMCLNPNVPAKQLAALVVHRIVATEGITTFFQTARNNALNFLINDGVTGINDASVMRFDSVCQFRHGVADRFAE